MDSKEEMKVEMDVGDFDGSGRGGDQDDIVDDTPEFVSAEDAVEVQVDDDTPMGFEDEKVYNDDDNGDTPAADSGGNMEETEDEVVVVDMSKANIDSAHTDSIYAIACTVQNGQLSILSGGGDDKAFLHRIPTDPTPESSSSSQQLAYNHTDTVSCVAFNLQFVSDDVKKTPRLAAVGSYDGTIILYDPDTAEQKLKLEGPSDVEWLCFHPKGGSVLLAGSGDGTVWMFHIPLNRCLQVFVGHEQLVSGGCFSSDGKWALSTSADGTLRIWAPKTGMNKHVFRLGEAGLTCMANNGGGDGMLVMAGAEDGQAHVCHIGTKKVVATLRHFDKPSNNSREDADDEEDMEHPMSVEAVGFSPSQPSWCATGGVDGRLKIWDLSKNGQCRQVCTPVQEDEPNSITRLKWHPTAPLVFTTTIKGEVYLWDARNGHLLYTMTGHTEMINDMDIQFLENGSAVVVSAGDDKTIRVFDVDINGILQQQQQQR